MNTPLPPKEFDKAQSGPAEDLCSTCYNLFQRLVVHAESVKDGAEPEAVEESLCMALPENKSDLSGLLVIECSFYEPSTQKKGQNEEDGE